MKLIQIKDYLLLIDEEAEIKEGNYIECIGDVIKPFSGVNEYYKRLSEDKPTYKWNKIIAYYPLTKESEELSLPLLPNPFEKEIDVEMLADVFSTSDKVHPADSYISKVSYIEGYKAAQSKQFSLEDMQKAIEMAREVDCSNYDYYGCCEKTYTEEEIIQSLSTQQLQKEFEPLIEIYDFDHGVGRSCIPIKILKTITNSEGSEELVGSYKY